MTLEPRMEQDAFQDSAASLPRGRVKVYTQTLLEAPGDALQTLLGLHGGIEVVGTPPEYVHAVGEVALAEQGIAEMALAEKASTKDDDVAEKAFLACDTPKDAEMYDALEVTGAAEEETQEYEIDSPDGGGVSEYEIGNPDNEDVAKTAVPALLDADTVMAETALAKAMSKDRSKGKPFKTSPSVSSFSWSQVLQSMGIGSTLGYNPISLSQYDGFSVSQFLPKTPKRNVVIHGA